jgi:hypothetical protein
VKRTVRETLSWWAMCLRFDLACAWQRLMRALFDRSFLFKTKDG